jgi:hypothetical protein
VKDPSSLTDLGSTEGKEKCRQTCKMKKRNTQFNNLAIVTSTAGLGLAERHKH